MSLKCSMNIQSSDGRSLLLKYVSSYVTKMKDHKPLKGLIHSIRSLHLDRILIEFVELSMQHILKYYLPNSKNTFFNKLLSIFFKYIYHFQCLILIFFAITYFSDIDMHDISGYTVGNNNLLLIICKYYLQKWRSISATLKSDKQVALLKSIACHSSITYLQTRLSWNIWIAQLLSNLLH